MLVPAIVFLRKTRGPLPPRYYIHIFIRLPAESKIHNLKSKIDTLCGSAFNSMFYILPSTFYLLAAAYWLLPTVCCLPPTVYFPPFKHFTDNPCDFFTGVSLCQRPCQLHKPAAYLSKLLFVFEHIFDCFYYWLN